MLSTLTRHLITPILHTCIRSAAIEHRLIQITNPDSRLQQPPGIVSAVQLDLQNHLLTPHSTHPNAQLALIKSNNAHEIQFYGYKSTCIPRFTTLHRSTPTHQSLTSFAQHIPPCAASISSKFPHTAMFPPSPHPLRPPSPLQLPHGFRV